MDISGPALRMRIYLGESDRLGHIPLYEAIVKRARKEGIAGATVLKGVLGFGASDHIRTSKLLDLSGDMPMVIEMVDTRLADVDGAPPLLKMADNQSGFGLVVGMPVVDWYGLDLAEPAITFTVAGEQVVPVGGPVTEEFDRGAVELGWSFQLHSYPYLKGYVQYFRGYGESLADAFSFAILRGYQWLITMDCDEQHEPDRRREADEERGDLAAGDGGGLLDAVAGRIDHRATIDEQTEGGR